MIIEIKLTFLLWVNILSSERSIVDNHFFVGC